MTAFNFFEMPLPQMVTWLDSDEHMAPKTRRFYQGQVDKEYGRRNDIGAKETGVLQANADAYEAEIVVGYTEMANEYAAIRREAALGDITTTEMRQRIQQVNSREVDLAFKEKALEETLRLKDRIQADPVQWLEDIYRKHNQQQIRWEYPGS